MRKLYLFLFILAITLSILVTLAVVSWYYAITSPSYYGSSWMGQMWGSHLGSDQNNWGMGGMMGGDGASTLTPSYLWLIPTVLIGVISIAIIGISFYLVYPELRYIRGKPCNTQNTQFAPNKVDQSPKENKGPTVASSGLLVSNCDVLLKTMTSEEQKVFNILVAHKGKYLQKYIVKESGLSRLKTHRIVARFAQRGIVTVNEFGNTNEVLLSEWVTNPNHGRNDMHQSQAN